MPWVDLYSKLDYASIYYTTNTSHSNVGSFDPEKPTIVILHPFFMDSSWLDLQFSDPRLCKSYNLIAFDMRCTGRSLCRPSGRHDSWVDSADLAFCFYNLYLPPSHILALEGASVNCALRFAVLFPELCLSLTLIDIPPPMELKWVYNAVDELTHNLCFAEDHDTFDHAAGEYIDFLFGSECDPDFKQDLFSHWAEAHPPHQRFRTLEMVNVLINRGPLTPDAYSSITQPVLIIHGEKNDLYHIKYAEKLVSQLTSVQDGAVLYTIRGGTTMLSVIPGHASIVNKVFTNFLSRLPHHRSDLERPRTQLRDRMKMALRRLGEMAGNPDAAGLDPLCSLSFSCLPPEAVKSQTDLLAHYKRNAHTAFLPFTTLENNDTTSRKSIDKKSENLTYVTKGSKGLVNKRSKHPTEFNETASEHHFASLDIPRISSPVTTISEVESTKSKSTSNPFQRLLA